MTTGFASQLSVALGVPGAGMALHSAVAGPGTVSTGAVVSCTRMLWEFVTALPQESVAFQVRTRV